MYQTLVYKYQCQFVVSTALTAIIYEYRGGYKFAHPPYFFNFKRIALASLQNRVSHIVMILEENEKIILN